MRIKILGFEFETEKSCPCKDYEEYEIKIKCLKTKLHSRYIAAIAVGICIWMFATTHTNASFVGQISFASTITSIILSVLAIIMSITGEGKTEHVKDQLEATAKDIKQSQDTVNDINKSVEENLKELSNSVVTLKEKIEHISEETAKRVWQYKEDVSGEASKVDEGMII